MTTKRNLRLAAAIGPATRDQLDQWADEHDRMWDRTVRIGAIVFGFGLIGLASLAAVEGFQAFHAASCMSQGQDSNLHFCGFAFGFLGSLVGVLAVLWLGWHFVVRRDVRPVNPYRPIDVTPADLAGANGAHPGVLAYLDAIGHQRRPIVQHDIDVLALIRRQQCPNQGG